MAVTGTITDLH